jgi:predicted alpha/beta-hydrolase family hydrolase
MHVRAVPQPRGTLVLGHGAGGGVDAPDLTAAADAAHGAGLTVVLVEQPYRVAGRRSPAPAAQLDAAWIAVVEQLPREGLLVTGGRSSGARVACRTAAATEAAAVLCLAFPLQPRRAGAATRLPELDAVRVPTLVVQGERDAFGIPPAAANRGVVLVPGDHSLRRAAPVGAAVSDWLRDLL